MKCNRSRRTDRKAQTSNCKASTKNASRQSGKLVHGNRGKSDSDLHPTLGQTQSAFGYVAKDEDIIALDKQRIGLLLLASGVLIALVMSIGLWMELASRSAPIQLLLVFPWLQLLATWAIERWIRRRVSPHVWVRGYSPRRST